MPVSWASKDPGATLDYVYHIPLDTGDSIADVSRVNFTKLAGTATFPAPTLASTPTTDTLPDGTTSYGQDLTVWLSGGTDGETAVFSASWTTVLTRTDDDIITILIANTQIAALDLVNFTLPLPGHLQMRYPAFGSVSASTIAYWLTDAQRFVGTSNWRSADYPIALMALAAHNMAIAGLVSDGMTAQIAGGISRFKMGPMEFDLTPQAANAKLAADFTSTRYGVEFMTLRTANLGGPRVAASGVPPFGIYPSGWPVGWP